MVLNVMAKLCCSIVKMSLSYWFYKRNEVIRLERQANTCELIHYIIIGRFLVFYWCMYVHVYVYTCVCVCMCVCFMKNTLNIS